MPVNQTIAFGNVTEIGVSLISKVDIASEGAFTLFIHIIIFMIILAAFMKKYNNFEKGLVAAGFVTGWLSVVLTIVGILSWEYIWMAVVLFITGFMFKSFE